MGSQARDIVEVVLHPVWDFALVRVGTGFNMNGTNAGYRAELYSGTNLSLRNQTVQCFGYGGRVR